MVQETKADEIDQERLEERTRCQAIMMRLERPGPWLRKPANDRNTEESPSVRSAVLDLVVHEREEDVVESLRRCVWSVKEWLNG